MLREERLKDALLVASVEVADPSLRSGFFRILRMTIAPSLRGSILEGSRKVSGAAVTAPLGQTVKRSSAAVALVDDTFRPNS
jgi:hypothetical protein